MTVFPFGILLVKRVLYFEQPPPCQANESNDAKILGLQGVKEQAQRKSWAVMGCREVLDPHAIRYHWVYA